MGIVKTADKLSGKTGFAEQFKALRLKMGLTQQQAAERIGVSRQTIHKWEKGETLPPEKPVVTRDQAFSRLSA